MSDYEMDQDVSPTLSPPAGSASTTGRPPLSISLNTDDLSSSDREHMAPAQSAKRKGAPNDGATGQHAERSRTAKKPRTASGAKQQANDGARKGPGQIVCLATPGRDAEPNNICPQADSLPIPKSLKDFSEADTMLWNMRKAGSGWKDIGDEWERMTGQRPASTTLPNRFTRMKENIGDFVEEDDQLMIKCKKDLESTFSTEIWAMLSEQMVIKGGNKFSAAALEKRFKQLTGAVKTEPDGEH